MLNRYSPQRSDRNLSYRFPAPDVVEATLDGVVDTFDFSSLPEGATVSAAQVTTMLVPCPVLAARRVYGQLEVTLLRFHGPTAPESERFPQTEVV